MATGKIRHDGRRQLFRGITTRMSYHNHSSSVDREEQKDQINETQTIQHSNIPQQQHHPQQIQPLPQQHQEYLHNEGIINAPTKSKRSLLSRNNDLITPTIKPKPISKGKQKGSFSSTTEAPHRIPFVSSNACSPISEATTNTDSTSTNRSDQMILRKDIDCDMNEYDYKTFSTNHPLRLSKVKAFEQAELTTRLYFSKNDDDSTKTTDVSYFNKKQLKHLINDNDDLRNNFSDGVKASTNLEGEIQTPGIFEDDGDDCEIVIQIPGLSKYETTSLFRYDAIDPRISEDKSLLTDNQNPGEFTTSTDRRLKIMRNALKPISKEDLVTSKLCNSSLPNVFQNSEDFLNDMDLQELEFWELMNDEFEVDMETLQKEMYHRSRKGHGLTDPDTSFTFVDAPFEALYGETVNIDLAKEVSSDIRKRIKSQLNNEDKYTLGMDVEHD